MSALTIPVQIKTAAVSGQVPTSLLPGELGLDPWLGRLWWADNNGAKQSASLPSIAAGAVASDLNVAQQNILYQGLLIAALRGVPTGLVDGVLDPFSSLADINTGASSGYTFSSSAGTIGATTTPGSATTVSGTGTAISDSDFSSGYVKSYAFDGNTSSYWASAANSTAGAYNTYIGQDFGAGNAKVVNQIVFTSANTANAFAGAVFQGSQDKSTWLTLATFTDLPTGTAVTTTRTISNNTAYRYYRLSPSVAATNPGCGELTMQNVPNASVAAVVLQSATLPSAVASPSAMRALIQVDSSSAALTPNTDLIVSLSRDGGTTFTQSTLSLVQTMPDGTTIYDTGWLSVTGQPAGNSTMTYKITTPTQKAIVLTGVSMQVKP